MQFKDYIQGNRRGKEAKRLEREVMNDPFLQEALDGFDTVAGDHAEIIDRLEKRFSTPIVVPQKNRRVFLYWSAAASVLILVGFSAFFFVARMAFSPNEFAFHELQENTSAILDDSSILPMEQTKESQQEFLVEAKEIPKQPICKKIVDKNEEMEVSYSKQQRIEKVSAVSSISKNDTIQSVFGEKEFQLYCQQKAGKSVCDGEGATVKVSFFIDEMGKPANIEYKHYSCEDARKKSKIC